MTDALKTSVYVHLATHGVPDGVFLSGATATEGVLSMSEVQELDMQKAKLIVLSECDSFRGKLTSDGVIGITRAFMAAGAPTLIASLWQVDDHATRVLLTSFYDLLLGEAAGDAAVALQQAMVQMIRTGRYAVSKWAAFVVYGLASDEAASNLPALARQMTEERELAEAIALSLEVS